MVSVPVSPLQQHLVQVALHELGVLGGLLAVVAVTADIVEAAADEGRVLLLFVPPLPKPLCAVS